MKQKRIIGISIVLILCCMLGIGAVVWANHERNENDVPTESETQYTEEGTEVLGDVETEIVEPEPEPQKIRLMMVGDNLMHMSVVHSGYQYDGSLDFALLFDPIKDYLNLADIKITNQETILGGNHLGLSAYPLFNSPTELGDSIAKAGFNVVLHASNHAADKGIEGLLNCVNFWKKYPDVVMTGIFENVDEENQDIGLLEIDGVTFAILNYTYSPNLNALPKWLQGHLAMLCDWDKETGKINFTKIHPDVLTDIEKAKQMADVVVVCPHWGNEYTFVPSVYQKQFAKQMTEAGADLIVGAHPHVIQPIEWIEAENGNKALCYYSLGNYVSTQHKPETMLEAMAWVVFEVKGDSIEIVEEETGAVPMVYQFKETRKFENVYFLDEYTEELAQRHGIQVLGDPGLSLENLQKWANEVLGKWRLPYQKPLLDCEESENQN